MPLPKNWEKILQPSPRKYDVPWNTNQQNIIKAMTAVTLIPVPLPNFVEPVALNSVNTVILLTAAGSVPAMNLPNVRLQVFLPMCVMPV